jgi:hypothetical protein
MGLPLLQSYSIVGVDLDTWSSDPLFEDCTDGFIVTRDTIMLAQICVTWFRDSFALSLAELGCEHYRAVSLATRRPRAEGDDLHDWHALSVAEQDAYIDEALRRSGLAHPGDDDDS